jgi:DNA-binding transcriptional MerR regulator
MSAKRAETALVKISELARLSGVPAPTIKHYMREGLLPKPARRTSRNMAYYDARLAERVRAIKELQQSHFLPLHVIGDLLAPAPSAALRDDLDDASRQRLGQFVPAVRAGHVESRRRAAGPLAGPKERKEILATMRLTADELDQLAALGLAEPQPQPDGRPRYADADLEIIEVIHETRARELDELFPMAILEPYVAKVRELVAMELDLFRRRVLDGDDGVSEAAMADIVRDAAHLAERLVVAMRAKLLLAATREPSAASIDAGRAAARPAGTAGPRRGRKKK